MPNNGREASTTPDKNSPSSPPISNGHVPISPIEQRGSSDDGSIDKMPGPSKRKRLSSIKIGAKANTKRLFKVDGAARDDDSEQEERRGLDILGHDPAFNTSHLVKRRRFRPGKSAEKALNTITSIGNAVIHPKDSLKSQATKTTAGQLSKAGRPYLSQKADLEFLQAHDNLKQAESTSSSKQGTSDEDQKSLISGHRDKIREMEAHRESLRAAWTTSRHVRRVRVVPKRHINLPKNDSFVERNASGEVLRYDWLRWLGYV